MAHTTETRVLYRRARWVFWSYVRTYVRSYYAHRAMPRMYILMINDIDPKF